MRYLIMRTVMITMHWYGNLNRYVFSNSGIKKIRFNTFSILFQDKTLKLWNLNFKTKGTYLGNISKENQPICFPPSIESHWLAETTAKDLRDPYTQLPRKCSSKYIRISKVVRGSTRITTKYWTVFAVTKATTSSY